MDEIVLDLPPEVMEKIVFIESAIETALTQVLGDKPRMKVVREPKPGNHFVVIEEGGE